MIASCAFRSLAAATIFIALVICWVFFTERMRLRMSRREAIGAAPYPPTGRCQCAPAGDGGLPHGREWNRLSSPPDGRTRQKAGVEAMGARGPRAHRRGAAGAGVLRRAAVPPPHRRFDGGPGR